MNSLSRLLLLELNYSISLCSRHDYLYFIANPQGSSEILALHNAERRSQLRDERAPAVLN